MKELEDRVESDHAPISIELEECVEMLQDREGEKIENTMEVFSWTEESVEIYRAQTEEKENTGEEGETVEENWGRVKRWVMKAVVKKKRRIKKWKIEQKRWWDRDCARKKRKVKQVLKEWKMGRIQKAKYLAERKEWRGLCFDKEREWKEVEIEKMKKLKKKSDVWQCINGENRRKGKMDNEINKEMWKDHFRNLLNGSENRRKGQGRG